MSDVRSHRSPWRSRGAARALRAVAAAALVAAVSVGCTTGQKDSSNYGEAEDAFIEGCTQIAQSDSEKIAEDPDGAGDRQEIASPTSYCRCVFDHIGRTVPFADFKRTNSQMRDEGGRLPSEITEAYETCDPADG